MKLSSAFAVAAITVVVLSGCQSTPQPKTVLVTAPPVLPPDRREAVWLPDLVAPYTAGRYVDPRDPNVVHEAHTIYRREQTSRANLAPPEFLVLPPVASPSATNGTALLRDALTAELNQQRATSCDLTANCFSLHKSFRRRVVSTAVVIAANKNFLRDNGCRLCVYLYF